MDTKEPQACERRRGQEVLTLLRLWTTPLALDPVGLQKKGKMEIPGEDGVLGPAPCPGPLLPPARRLRPARSRPRTVDRLIVVPLSGGPTALPLCPSGRH